MKSSWRLTGVSLLSGLVLASGLLTTGTNAATAQAAAPAASDAPAAPKQVGNWFVRCATAASQYPCEAFTGLNNKQTGQRVLMVSFAFVPSANKNVMVIALPLEISIQKGVVIQTDSFTSPVLHYHRCDAGGCYVEMIMENASLDALGHSGANAALKIVLDSGKDYNLPLSLDGFAGARDTMVELAKQKAKTPPQQINAAPTAP